MSSPSQTTFGSWLIGGAQGPAAASAPRDPRVDFFRGFALLVIFADHVAGNVLSRVTPSAMGFSDAAEAFVLLAGYSAALAYGATIDRQGLVTGSAQLVARIWKLYTAHLGLFLFMAVSVVLMARAADNPIYYEHVAILPFFQDPVGSMPAVASLMFLPNYLDILPLYVVLLALVPAIWVLTRIAPILAIAASAALYAASWGYGLALPNMATGGQWFFNPFAWQLLFTVGLVAGHATLHGVALPKGRALLAIAGLIVAFGLVNAAPWSAIPGLERVTLPDAWRVDPDKTNLSLWRFSHNLALAFLLAAMIPRQAAFFNHRAAGLLVEAGKHSLPLFCLGVILSLAGTYVFFEIGRDHAMQALVNVIGFGLILGLGQMIAWYRGLSGKGARRKKDGALDEARAT